MKTISCPPASSQGIASPKGRFNGKGRHEEAREWIELDYNAPMVSYGDQLSVENLEMYLAAIRRAQVHIYTHIHTSTHSHTHARAHTHSIEGRSDTMHVCRSLQIQSMSTRLVCWGGGGGGGGGVVSQHICTRIQKQSPILRLSLLRKLTCDFTVDATSSMMLLAALTSGIFDLCTYLYLFICMLV